MSNVTLANRMIQVEQRLNDIDNKLDRLIASFMGDGINAGFVGETRDRLKQTDKDLHDLNVALQTMTTRVLSPGEMRDLRKVLSFLTGWKLTIGLALWLAPLITLTIKILN
jgi:hypothetical protein